MGGQVDELLYMPHPSCGQGLKVEKIHNLGYLQMLFVPQ